MSTERHRLTDWKAFSEDADRAWIRENIESFSALAMEQFDELGPGAILVDTLSKNEVTGHPFWYLPQAAFEAMDDDNTLALMREIDPAEELIVILIKSGNLSSTYRVNSSK